MPKAALRILVLADTHNHLPKNFESLAADADEIWHLGDICAPAFLVKMEETGRAVKVVRGNCDDNMEWPLALDFERRGLRFHLVHIPPTRSPGGCEFLLHGHTHVPRDEMRNGVRFLNPGCVTRPNRGAPSSVAWIEISADGNFSWRLQLLSR